MNPSVVLFSKPRCVQCTAVARTLTSAGVPFTTTDLGAPENATQLAWFKSQGFLSAPITVYGSSFTIPGFNPDALDELIAAYRADHSELPTNTQEGIAA